MNSRKASFGTKAETLDLLYRGFPELNIPRPFILPSLRWKREAGAVLRELRQGLPGQERVAVRSSCRMEDGARTSCAGAFVSRLDVPLHDDAAMDAAIGAVITSYADPDDEHLLIQPMVGRVAVSGVIMTRALDDGSPYYVLNYDDESGKTDTVTGGKGSSKTVYVYKGVQDSDFDSPRVRKMVGLARTLERIFDSTALDIEFGLDDRGEMHLFQVRRICTSAARGPEAAAGVSGKIALVERQVRDILAPRSGLHGQTNILGVMPDWNPAEIIGVTPRPLAASIYREAVTRRVWSLARERMGYRPLPMVELMALIAGRPYIDVRASFNSFLPAGLDPDSGRRLVEAWLGRLERRPELHDKVEFEVAFTAMDLDLAARMEAWYPGLLAFGERRDYLAALAQLTACALDVTPRGSLASGEAEIGRLAALQAARADRGASAHDAGALLVQARALLEECRVLGTVPFSMLARHGFIAEALLRSAVRRGALAPERVQDLKRSIATISRELSRDFDAVCAGRLDQAAFMRRYGHLRPGTYDILSLNYARRTGLFNGHGPHPAHPCGEEPFAFSARERRDLEILLQEAGLGRLDASGLLDYTRRAVAGREYGKFVFTRNISDLLDILARWGEGLGLDLETLSFLALPEIFAGPDDPDRFLDLAQEGRRIFELGRSLKLSYLIRSPRDVYIVPSHKSAPNFITANRVEGEVALCDAKSDSNVCISGRIVCIENADPGFDWIFAKGIAGLVTKFGGANSHMAIRCAEYGIPAAIGCGEMLFAQVSVAARCILDAGAHVVRQL